MTWTTATRDCLLGVRRRAHRQRVAVGSRPGSRGEVELRPGGVDAEVVGHPPSPTQVFEGIQFQSAFGDTTITSCGPFSRRLRCRAAVWPEIPAPRITTLAIGAFPRHRSRSSASHPGARSSLATTRRPRAPELKEKRCSRNRPNRLRLAHRDSHLRRLAAGGLVALHWQRSAGGTWPRTCSTWAPHPFQVGRPQVRQFAALHIPPRVSASEALRSPAMEGRPLTLRPSTRGTSDRTEPGGIGRPQLAADWAIWDRELTRLARLANLVLCASTCTRRRPTSRGW